MPPCVTVSHVAHTVYSIQSWIVTQILYFCMYSIWSKLPERRNVLQSEHPTKVVFSSGSVFLMLLDWLSSICFWQSEHLPSPHLEPRKRDIPSFLYCQHIPNRECAGACRRHSSAVEMACIKSDVYWELAGGKNSWLHSTFPVEYSKTKQNMNL